VRHADGCARLAGRSTTGEHNEGNDQQKTARGGLPVRRNFSHFLFVNVSKKKAPTMDKVVVTLAVYCLVLFGTILVVTTNRQFCSTCSFH